MVSKTKALCSVRSTRKKWLSQNETRSTCAVQILLTVVLSLKFPFAVACYGLHFRKTCRLKAFSVLTSVM